MKTRSMEESVVMRGCGSLDPQNLGINITQFYQTTSTSFAKLINTTTVK